MTERPCQCAEVAFSAASLIPQPWMRSRKHIPATRCRCGKRYYSWSAEKEFACVEPGQQTQSEVSHD